MCSLPIWEGSSLQSPFPMSLLDHKCTSCIDEYIKCSVHAFVCACVG